VGTLTALNFTGSSVAKVGTLEYVTVRALGPLVAISVEAKCATNGIRLRMFGMHIRAGRVVALAFRKVQAQRRSFLCDFVGEVARVALGAFALGEPPPTDGHFGYVVSVAAFGALGAVAWEIRVSIYAQGFLPRPEYGIRR
jgi:hypothetical protein